MKFCKLSFSIFIFLILAFSFRIPALAGEEFSTDAAVTYTIQESGKAEVTYDITLTNNFSTLYATSYSLTLENIDVQNVRAFSDQGGAYSFDAVKDGEKTNIKIEFGDPVVGKGARRHFFVTYENNEIAQRTGEVWEISIPRLGNKESFENYSVKLNVPLDFGLEAYISPKPKSMTISDAGRIYEFSRDEIVETGITAGFGQFQVFSFNLAYHLENPLAVSTDTYIALPPDTAFQKIYYSQIEPKPKNISLDADGNWIARYHLAPRQRIDVAASGSVQIFASYRKFPKSSEKTLSDNLKESQYWQVSDPSIIKLAQELKTPRAIYDYVVGTLKYNLDRVQPNVQRYGAVKALQNSNDAICMEFTDLFIAIARAAGIPAREVNGFAYTENPVLQPLSLVADVLHSWPEYYDSGHDVWIPIDPTWASTTGGVDFFSKLDLRHFTFVVHGESATLPYPPGSYKLGSNPQKDIFVSFGKLPEERTSIPVITIADKRFLPFMDSVYNAQIYNPGPEALYFVNPIIYFDGKEKSRDFIEVLPPFSSYKLSVRVPFSLLGKNTPDKLKIAASGSQLEITTNKSQVIVNSLIALFAVFFAFMVAILIKLKKISFAPFSAKIRSAYAKIRQKIFGLFGKNPPVRPQ